MLNYFNYFTEIEERFSRRKGQMHMLSTLDWALVEIWKDAGIPLAAVLQGIDAAFDHWDKRPERHKVRKVNSLAFCAQEVLAAAQEMAAAAVGAAAAAKPERETGFEERHVSDFVRTNADDLAKAKLPEAVRVVARETEQRLREIADEIQSGVMKNEDAERHLTVMEQKLYAAVMAATPDAELIDIRSEAEREMSPYKRKMQAAQIAQLEQQFIQKRLLERCNIPRLSLFYLY